MPPLTALPESPSLARVADRLPLETDALALRVESVLNEELYWFPVRHHSPSAARHLETVLLARKPKVIFLEAPAEAQSMVEFLIDDETKPPVAIYSSYRDDENILGLAGIFSPSPDIPARFACWYPLVEYSPEYVALRTAKKIGAEVIFIDLPHYALIRRAMVDSGPSGEREDDQLLEDSGFFQTLASVAGYRSFPEAWDSIFEFGALDDPESFRRELATFCAAARATTPLERMEHDGTRERERHMLQVIRQTLKAKKLKPQQGAVVCGGFHLFLDQDDPLPPPECPPGTVYTSLVPYTFFRISELSGYAAGNRAPQFYQMHWDCLRGKLADLGGHYILEVLARTRKKGELHSSADAISATQHARLLAALRGRPVPIFDDLRDALITCCCKGDPQTEGQTLREAMDDAGIGTKIGKVTARLDRLPLVADFQSHLHTLELGEVMGREKRLALTLDKRQPKDSARSVFLHRVVFLQVPFGQLTEAPTPDVGTGRIFRERWALRWKPDVEAALIEHSLYGDTVEAAVLSRLKEQLATSAQDAAATCERLVQAVNMDLPDLVSQAQVVCQQALDSDQRFISLSQALSHLHLIHRYAEHREIRRDLLEELVTRCYNRACFALIDAINAPEDQQAEVISGLMILAETVQRRDAELIDRNLFTVHVRHAAEQTTVPFLRGAFLGMLTELRENSPEQLAQEIADLALSAQDQMLTAGDLLDGIMAVSRASILLGAKPLIEAIDKLLRAAEWESFLIMLPRLRSAFERLHARQRESLAVTVAERYGLKETASVTELRTSAAGAVLFARIDKRVAELMERWEF